jgi:hypothetical protein
MPDCRTASGNKPEVRRGNGRLGLCPMDRICEAAIDFESLRAKGAQDGNFNMCATKAVVEWCADIAFYSERRACTASTRAARAAGMADAIKAAAKIRMADASSGNTPGICTSVMYLARARAQT